MNTEKTTSSSQIKAAPKSISRWLIASSAIGTALALVLLMGTSLNRSYQNSISDSTHSHTVITGLLGTQVAGGLRWKKQAVVNAVFESSVAAVENNNLALAHVYDSDGVLWLEYVPDSHDGSGIEPASAFVAANLQTEAKAHKLEKTALTVVSPLLSGKNEQRIGTLVVVWDFSNEKSSAQQVWITGTLLALACLVLLLVSQWWAISHLVGRPLRKISAQMAQLATGHTDIEVEGRNRPDEIGAIAKAVEVFRRDAIEADKLRHEQALASEESEHQRNLLAKADEEKQRERTRELEGQRTRADRESEAAKSLKQRIEALLHAVDAAAHGNLDYVIDFGDERDDLQQVALALNNMFKELRQSFELIGQQSGELNSSAKQLKSLGVTISSVAGESTSRTTYASEKSVHVSATVETVASATHQMGASIEQIAMNAGDAANVANQAVQLAESTDVSIRKLSESSNGIGKVIKVINSIAEQTNLLALNATIEAARAGDAGKGFAVVANEVKELAKETANATEEIEKRIASIQTDTSNAVQAIADINQIVRQISETQQVIATSVEEQTETTQEINRTIVETSKANDEINSVMDGVVAQTQSACDSAANVETAAARLGDIAMSLDELLRKFQKRHAA